VQVEILLIGCTANHKKTTQHVRRQLQLSTSHLCIIYAEKSIYLLKTNHTQWQSLRL